MEKENGCVYCTGGAEIGGFGIRIHELRASVVYLFREQSHPGRVIVASKSHVGEITDLSRRERQEFMDDVAQAAEALRKIFRPAKINYGAYGDTCAHLHFHLVPKDAADPFEWGGVFAMNPARTFLTDADYAERIAKIKAELCFGSTSDLHKALVDLRGDIRKDGRVDFAEATCLLRALESLAGSNANLDAVVKTLREVRADGAVSPDESARILHLLDGLVS